MLLLSWRLRLSWRTERLKLRLGLRRQGREDEAHRWVFPGGKGVREREGVEGNGCGSRGGGGSVAGSGAGLGRGGTRPQPGGVGRGRKRELVGGGRRAGGSGRGRGGRAKGVYKRDEREILVVWLKAAAQCWLIRGNVSADAGSTHRLISSMIESMCHPCSFRRQATTRVVWDTPSTSAM